MKNNSDYPLVRFLATTGFGSRRSCDDLIKSGRVKVNGDTAGHGIRIQPGVDIVTVDDEKVDLPPIFIYLLLYKPKGYLVSDSDPENRPLAKDLLPDFNMRLFPVGRLDFQTEGAILYTNDGLFANDIAHPRNSIPKTYLAKVRNIPARETLIRWRKGIRDDNQLLKALDVSIEKTTHQNAWLRVTLTGGANRQVRRMGKATGHPVVKLIRLSIGNLAIGTLKPGEYRELTTREINGLKHYQPTDRERSTARLPTGIRSRIQVKDETQKKPQTRRLRSGDIKRHATKKAIKNRRSK
ncbi:rRNA pseudouridine synthase [bacterium]|nr:rRNA pseudouridine synthase [candidate division CSSED10-310 bacterium]